MRCIWNIRSPPFTNSITKNKLEQNDISVYYSTEEINKKDQNCNKFFSNHLYFSLASPHSKLPLSLMDTTIWKTAVKKIYLLWIKLTLFPVELRCTTYYDFQPHIKWSQQLFFQKRHVPSTGLPNWTSPLNWNPLKIVWEEMFVEIKPCRFSWKFKVNIWRD